MSTIFTRIIRREIPAHIVHENAGFIAFLDIQPIKQGHTLVVPKKEIDELFNHTDKDIGALFVFAKEVARKLKGAVPCQRIGVAVVGLEVPHTHVHLVPLDTVHDIDFSRPKLQLSDEALHALALRISAQA